MEEINNVSRRSLRARYGGIDSKHRLTLQADLNTSLLGTGVNEYYGPPAALHHTLKRAIAHNNARTSDTRR